jgi:hypothetical protein
VKRDQELIVITKTYDLILWSCNHTSQFARNHRFVLGERIERNLYGLFETLIAAKHIRRTASGSWKTPTWHRGHPTQSTDNLISMDWIRKVYDEGVGSFRDRGGYVPRTVRR